MPTFHSASADDTLFTSGRYSPILAHALSDHKLRSLDQLEHGEHTSWNRRGPRGLPIRLASDSLVDSTLGCWPLNRDRSVQVSSCPSPPPSTTSDSSVLIDLEENHEQHREGSPNYPTPPASDCGDADTPSRENSTFEEFEGLSFPLDPAPLLSVRPVEQEEVLWTARRRPINAASRGTPFSPSPDRFVPTRSLSHDPVRTFRLSKPPPQLTPEEKILRRNSATRDPFGPLRVPRTRDERSRQSGNGDAVANRVPSRPIATTNVVALPRDPLGGQNRQISAGSVWNVGAITQPSQSAPVRGVPNGRGGLLSSGSNARMYTSQFLGDLSTDKDVEIMEKRLAAALDINRTCRVFDLSQLAEERRSVSTGSIGLKRKRIFVEPRTVWRDGEWVREGSSSLLDAPNLRDDYYCTVLAYCYSTRTLAVGLANRVYLWSEDFGVRYPPDDPNSNVSVYVTSVSFSSTEGGHSILGIGRSNGQVSLWSLHDPEDIRFTTQHPSAIACVAFKPLITRRPSERFGSTVPTEELLVGDEVGNVYYYSVEWMTRQQIDIHGWNGSMKLLAKISVHSQQICGLAWSPKGDYFATGANDNACCLFEIKDVLSQPVPLQDIRPLYKRPLQTLIDGIGLSSIVARAYSRPGVATTTRTHSDTSGHIPLLSQPIPPLLQRARITPGQDGSLLIGEGRQKHKWLHSAAIKAIAFCPWQCGLLATGGGSNDRAIHFYHTFSGATLATINVHAQVTSLIWSTTRREIAATFGYAQPEHPYRIAVFSWPDCRQVVAIPWGHDMRALLAIPYPGGPGEAKTLRTGLGGAWYSRTAEEGCIVVACSDESVKFHEVWSGASKETGGHVGLLGGSKILEALEGIEGGEVIR